VKIAFTPHVEHYTIGMLNELKKNHIVILISDKKYNIDGIRFLFLPKTRLPYINLFTRSIFLEKIASCLEYDVFHVNSAIDGCSISNFEKIILTEHGYPNIWVETFSKKPYYIKEMKCLEVLYSIGVPIIAISNYTSTMLYKYLGVKATKVIYHGLLDEFRVNVPRVPRKRHVLLWIGRFVPAKEPEVFLHALKLVRGRKLFKVIIRGDGPLRFKILKLVKKMGLENKVRFLKRMPFYDVIKLYRIASIYVHTASAEPFGFSVLEAMGSGLPVIVPRAGGAYEVAGPQSLTFYPGDSFDLADKIESLIDDEEEYYKQSKRSIERAKYFCWGKTVKEYIEVYKKIL